MALNLTRSKKSNMDLNDPQMRAYVMQQLGIEEPKPKANILSRLISALSAFETGNAVYKGMEEDSVLAGLGQYAKDVVGGLGSLVTGNVDEDKKTYSDVLEELGVENKIVKSVGGFIGDVALDPASYVTLGVGSGTKLGGKTLTKAGTEVSQRYGAKALERIGKEGIEEFATKEGIEIVGQPIAREVIEKYTIKKMSERAAKTGANYFKKDAMRFAGKEVLDLSESGVLKTGLKSYFDPISATVEGANKLGIGKAASELTGKVLYPVRKLFDRSAELAGEAGIEKEFKPLIDATLKLQDATRYSRGVANRKATEWYNLMNKSKVAPEIFPYIYENTPEEVWRQLPQETVAKLDEFYNIIKGAAGQGDVPKELAQKIPIEQVTKKVQQYQDSLVKNAEFIVDPSKKYTGKLLSDDANIGQFLGLKDKLQLRSEEINSALIKAGVLESGAEVPYLSRQVLKTPGGKVVGGGGKTVMDNTRNAFKNRTYKYLAENEIAGGITTTTGKTGKEAAAAIAEQIGKTEATLAKAIAWNDYQEAAKGFRDASGELIAKSYHDLFELGGDPVTKQVGKTTQNFLDDNHRALSEYVKGEIGRKLDESISKIWEQLDIAEGGRITTFRNLDDEVEYLAKSSSYPDWLPEHLRKQKIVKQVQKALVDNYNIKSGTLAEEAYNLAIKEAKRLVNTQDIDDLIEEVKVLNKQAGTTTKVLEEALDMRTQVPSLIKSGAYRQIRSGLNGKVMFDGMYFPKEAADIMEKTHKAFFGDENMNNIVKLYDGLMRKWKKSVTSFFPAFHARNGFSNVFTNAMAGVKSPKPYIDATSVQKFMNAGIEFGFDSKEAKELGGKMIAKTGMNIRELLDVAERYGVVQSGTFYDEISTGFLKNKSKVLDRLNISKYGNYIEENAKLAHFIDKLNKGYGIDDAARSVKKYLFDYGDLTDFEKNVMRRVMPFYTWTRKNIELQLKEMASKPGQYGAILKGFRDIEDAFTDISEEDKAKLPSWVKDGVEVIVGEDGKARAFYGFGTPIEAFSSAIGGIIPGTEDPSIMGSINPITKFFLEKSFDKNMFTGEQISTDIDARNWKSLLNEMPQELKDAIGYKEMERTTSQGTKYTEYIMDPNAKYIINILFSRFAATGGKLAGAFDEEGTGANWLDIMSGVKTKEFDLAEEDVKRQREMEKLLYEELIKRGYAKEMYKPYITKEAKGEL